MKAILKFNLPEENTEFRMAVHASAYVNVLTELLEILRSAVKYGTPPSTHKKENSSPQLTGEEQTMCDSIRSEIFQLLEDHDVSLEGL